MTEEIHPARVRFAPSPTGRLHIGGARTALYNYLLAGQTGGQFILRLEDTDRKRYQPETEQELIDGLHWLGLSWEEGFDVAGPYAPYRQSQRKELYLKYARQLIEQGDAYYCFCTPERLQQLRQEQQKAKLQSRYDGRCRVIPAVTAAERAAAGERCVIRFRMPQEGSITVLDALRGEITVENATLDDYIIVKSDGLALYHLAVVVDDHLMKISHVFRTSEWLPTFPLHGHLYQAFGWDQPIWVHPSIFLKPSGKGKMSKRETEEMAKGGPSIFLSDLEGLGYLPEAVVNWIALMGWSYDDRTEFFTMQNLIDKFSIDRLNPAPAAINFSKLDHFNGLHIRNLEPGDLAARLKPFYLAAGYQVDEEKLIKIIPLIQMRMVTLDDAPRISGFFFREDITPEPGDLIGKKMTQEGSAAALRGARQVIEALAEFSVDQLEAALRVLAESQDLKAGQLFGILRTAVTGQAVSPPLFESMVVIGREKVLLRIDQAAGLLSTTP
jgi:glutamyl-tRNA synthetase